MTRADLFNDLSGTVGVEVGVAIGDFSEEILSKGVGHLYLVDPWRAGYAPKDPNDVPQPEQDARYQAVCNRFHNRPVSVLRLTSREAAQFLDSKLDFAYIDAAHDVDSVLSDLQAWSKKCRILMGHDYTDRPEAIRMGFGVVEAVEKFLSYNPAWELRMVTDEEWPSYRLEEMK